MTSLDPRSLLLIHYCIRMVKKLSGWGVHHAIIHFNNLEAEHFLKIATCLDIQKPNQKLLPGSSFPSQKQILWPVQNTPFKYHDSKLKCHVSIFQPNTFHSWLPVRKYSVIKVIPKKIQKPGSLFRLEDHPRTCKWLGSPPICKPIKKGHLEGVQSNPPP